MKRSSVWIMVAVFATTVGWFAAYAKAEDAQAPAAEDGKLAADALAAVADAAQAAENAEQKADAESGATLLSPKNDDEVQSIAIVQGRVHMKGWPIALVAAEGSVEGWWVQAPVVPTTPGHFQAPIRIGNFTTKAGTAFNVMVVMARTPEEYQQLRAEEVIEKLPSDLPRSASVRLVLAEDKAPRVPDVVESPTPLMPVGRIETVRGRVGRGQIPVVLVRSADPKGEWWVQKAPKLAADGRFEGTALFGNEKTPIGQSFHVMVLCASADDKLNFKEGDALFVLPKHVPRSDEIIVIRANENGNPLAQVGK
ncbi:MAG: hypothetical protein KDA55_14695 [Planctomycetales bacterium]|nr:hypothetical protein [Planctomycetales bacterium]